MAAGVPFNDLRRRAANYGDQLTAIAERVVRSGWYLLGPETEAFETEFAAFCGAAGAVAVANGTDALEIGLRSVGCRAGDEVVLAANAGGYSSAACLAVGAVPVYADVAPDTLLTTPEALAAAVGPATSVVVATHLYGNVVDVEALEALVPGVVVLEDCAQAHGATLRGRRVGSLGHLAAFSFYPTKNLGGLGDGGALVSDDAEVLERARRLHEYGWESRYLATLPGGRNSRLDELQAAFLRVLLPGLDEKNRRRVAVRDRLRAELGDTLRFTADAPDALVVAHLCVVRSPERDRVVAALAELGVACAVHYPVPDHRQPVMEAATHRHHGLDETERACAEVMSLPCFPELTDAEVDRVIEATAKVIR